LFHTVARAVPSALEGLTSVFGMGTGVTPPLGSPGKHLKRVLDSYPERETAQANISALNQEKIYRIICVFIDDRFVAGVDDRPIQRPACGCSIHAPIVLNGGKDLCLTVDSDFHLALRPGIPAVDVQREVIREIIV